MLAHIAYDIILSHVLFILYLLSLFMILYFSYQYTLLRTYPGPFLASFTDFYSLWDVFWNSTDPKGPTVELHNKYGDVVRHGPNMLLFTDPRAIKDIYVPGGGLAKEFSKVSSLDLK
jgi:hypothetical protein